MITHYNQIDYDRMAKKAVEKNIGYFLRKLSRDGDITIARKKRRYLRKRTKTSQYKWVSFSKKQTKNPWKVMYKDKYLGSFKTEELAHKAVLKYEKYIEKEEAKIAA